MQLNTTSNILLFFLTIITITPQFKHTSPNTFSIKKNITENFSNFKIILTIFDFCQTIFKYFKLFFTKGIFAFLIKLVL